MCNLYSSTTAREAMRRLFPNARDSLGDQPLPASIYPNQEAPIVRNSAEGLELARARWGLPTPPRYLEGKSVDRGVTNVRNVASAHWRRWLGPASRCLVPFSKFSEPGPGGPIWFDFVDPPTDGAYFAGLWVPQWTSVRRLKDGSTTDDLFAFLTCEPNAEVGAIHPKAMPAILTTEAERQAWLSASWEVARLLQRPLPDGTLKAAA